jgi:glutamate synthase (NADPH) large chain
MSGGVAYVLDLDHSHVNRELVDLGPLRPEDELVVHDLLERHHAWTDSPVAARLLAEWDTARSAFTLVLPRAYQRVIDVRSKAAAEGLDPDGAQVWERIMEASRG